VRNEAIRRVMISGCSSGGKSSLLAELARRGYAVFDEPGRQVVKAELANGGDGLPWMDVGRFIDLCVALAVRQWEEAARAGSLAFFDRGIVDALANRAHRNLPMPEEFAGLPMSHRYHPRMFMAPPWPEIYVNDTERRHSFAQAAAEHDMLVEAYGRFGYEVVTLPKISVEARADFVLAQLNLAAPE
jgi:predicted ATPase